MGKIYGPVEFKIKIVVRPEDLETVIDYYTTCSNREGEVRCFGLLIPPAFSGERFILTFARQPYLGLSGSIEYEPVSQIGSPDISWRGKHPL